MPHNKTIEYMNLNIGKAVKKCRYIGGAVIFAFFYVA